MAAREAASRSPLKLSHLLTEVVRSPGVDGEVENPTLTWSASLKVTVERVARVSPLLFRCSTAIVSGAMLLLAFSVKQKKQTK